MKWRFSVYHLTETLVSENLDNVMSRYYRKWLHFLVSGSITYLSLPKYKFCLNIKTLKQCMPSANLVSDKLLIYHLTKKLELYINLQTIKIKYRLFNKLNRHSWITSLHKQHEKYTMETIWNEFLDLKEQCGIIKFLVNLIPTNQPVQWQKDTLSLPKNTVNFARRYLIYSLSNGTNLQKWKKTGTSNY